MRSELITSKHNPLIMYTASLTERKYRRREGAFRFDGRKLFSEALAYGLPLSAILLKESSAGEFLEMLEKAPCPEDCRVAILPDALFLRLSEENAPEGVICVSKNLDKIHKIVTISKECDFAAVFRKGPTLFLESLRDPGNLGTVIRSARAFGIQNLILSADCADLYHPKTLRAAMGTLFGQSAVVVDDLVSAMQLWQRGGGRVLAAALEPTAMRLGEVELGGMDAVLVGNEGHGLSKEAIGAADTCIYIPMEKGVESLNAGIAASLLLWEIYRGR